MSDTRLCNREDHPADTHGHYGYGGRYWCRDLGSPLLSEENMGVQERGRVVLYARSTPTEQGVKS